MENRQYINIKVMAKQMSAYPNIRIVIRFKNEFHTVASYYQSISNIDTQFTNWNNKCNLELVCFQNLYSKIC